MLNMVTVQSYEIDRSILSDFVMSSEDMGATGLKLLRIHLSCSSMITMSLDDEYYQKDHVTQRE